MHNRRVITFFLCAQGLLYAAFLSIDILRPSWGLDIPLKYLSIFLCLLFSITALERGYSRAITAALAFSLLADTFLLVLDQFYLVGVLSFFVAQIFYLHYICRRAGCSFCHKLFLRLPLGLGAILLVAVAGALEPLTAITAVYFSLLCANAVNSLLLGRRHCLFSTGLLLLLCCDLCVGLHNLSAFLPLSISVYARAVEIGMWLFYLPSQVLIALSGQRERM